MNTGEDASTGRQVFHLSNNQNKNEIQGQGQYAGKGWVISKRQTGQGKPETTSKASIAIHNQTVW